MLSSPGPSPSPSPCPNRPPSWLKVSKNGKKKDLDQGLTLKSNMSWTDSLNCCSVYKVPSASSDQLVKHLCHQYETFWPSWSSSPTLTPWLSKVWQPDYHVEGDINTDYLVLYFPFPAWSLKKLSSNLVSFNYLLNGHSLKSPFWLYMGTKSKQSHILIIFCLCCTRLCSFMPLSLSKNIYFNIYWIDIIDYWLSKRGICPIRSLECRHKHNSQPFRKLKIRYDALGLFQGLFQVHLEVPLKVPQKSQSRKLFGSDRRWRS